MKLIIGSALLVSSVLGAGYGYGYDYKAPSIPKLDLNFGYKPQPRYERKYEPSTKHESSESSDSHYDSTESHYGSSESSESSEAHSDYKPVHNKCGKNEIPVTNSPGLCECDYVNRFARLDGVNCLKCPTRGFWDATAHYGKGECKCEFGLVFDSHGQCVQPKAHY